jgi:hypothetical protein
LLLENARRLRLAASEVSDVTNYLSAQARLDASGLAEVRDALESYARALDAIVHLYEETDLAVDRDVAAATPPSVQSIEADDEVLNAMLPRGESRLPTVDRARPVTSRWIFYAVSASAAQEDQLLRDFVHALSDLGAISVEMEGEVVRGSILAHFKAVWSSRRAATKAADALTDRLAQSKRTGGVVDLVNTAGGGIPLKKGAIFDGRNLVLSSTDGDGMPEVFAFSLNRQQAKLLQANPHWLYDDLRTILARIAAVDLPKEELSGQRSPKPLPPPSPPLGSRSP